MAQLRVVQGRYAEALELFAPLLQDERNPRLGMNEKVPIARHGVGDRAGAIALLERFGAEPFIAMTRHFGSLSWLSCQLRLAEYYLEDGRTADAARVANIVRAHLVLADADHPFLPRLAKLP